LGGIHRKGGLKWTLRHGTKRCRVKEEGEVAQPKAAGHKRNFRRVGRGKSAHAKRSRSGEGVGIRRVLAQEEMRKEKEKGRIMGTKTQPKWKRNSTRDDRPAQKVKSAGKPGSWGGEKGSGKGGRKE